MELTYYLILFFTSFVITWITVPVIRAVIIKNRILQKPNFRSAHSLITPSFGGIVFFIVFIIGVLITPEIVEKVFDSCKMGKYTSLLMRGSMVSAYLVILFTGIQDDNKILSPLKKLFGQFLAAAFIVSFEQFRIKNFYGLLGIYDVPLLVSVIFSILIIIIFINSFNLIDGIDGNASLNGISISLLFGYLFYCIHSMFFMGFCIIIIGTLTSFLRYNFSSIKKIFMGDTGSLVLGLTFSILMLKLLNIQDDKHFTFPFDFNEMPLIILATVFLPLFDTIRVIVLRIKMKRPIYKPDRNHLHHYVIDLGFSHKRASLIINTLNFLFSIFIILLCINFDFIHGLIAYITIILLLLLFLNRK